MRSIADRISSGQMRGERDTVIFKDLENALLESILDLKPAPETPAEDLFLEEMTFDYSEQDNGRWKELIAGYLKKAKSFEVHCWNEETEWILLALQYGKLKDDDWKYGKIITGDVTPQFIEMILTLPKPADTEIYNKMTPFFNVFLDDVFQSGHYGTENYYK